MKHKIYNSSTELRLMELNQNIKSINDEPRYATLYAPMEKLLAYKSELETIIAEQKAQDEWCLAQLDEPFPKTIMGKAKMSHQWLQDMTYDQMIYKGQLTDR